MNTEQKQFLTAGCQKYAWWETPQEALRCPCKLLARIMDSGLWQDVCTLSRLHAKEELGRVLACSEPGDFSEKSWHFWHCRLGLCELGQVPRLLVRKHLPLVQDVTGR